MLVARFTGMPKAGRTLLLRHSAPGARLKVGKDGGIAAAGSSSARYFASAGNNSTPALFCEQAIASAPVVVFSRSWCPFCKQLETLFGKVISPDLRVANIGVPLVHRSHCHRLILRSSR